MSIESRVYDGIVRIRRQGDSEKEYELFVSLAAMRRLKIETNPLLVQTTEFEVDAVMGIPVKLDPRLKHEEMVLRNTRPSGLVRKITHGVFI